MQYVCMHVCGLSLSQAWMRIRECVECVVKYVRVSSKLRMDVVAGGAGAGEFANADVLLTYADVC
jgi:hypothetical protein